MHSDDEAQEIDWDNLNTITTFDSCELFTKLNEYF